jgi:proteasome lid subunit RPN8/RPN11
LHKTIVFNSALMDRFLGDVRQRFPRKTFGYFLARSRFGQPEDYIVMAENVRDDWLQDFHAYGQYYVDHHDAGFLATPEETWRVEREIRRREMFKVGVFHSHQRHPGILTSVDVDFHPEPDLWHALVVLRNLDYPQFRAFDILPGGRVAERPVTVSALAGAAS